MKRQYVTDLVEGAQVDDVFVLRRKDLRIGRSGRPYLALELGDKTGFFQARLFDGATEAAAACGEGGFVRTTGIVRSYRGAREVLVRKIQTVEPADGTEDFIPSSNRRPDELLGYLEFLCAEVYKIGRASCRERV